MQSCLQSRGFETPYTYCFASCRHLTWVFMFGILIFIFTLLLVFDFTTRQKQAETPERGRNTRCRLFLTKAAHILFTFINFKRTPNYSYVFVCRAISIPSDAYCSVFLFSSGGCWGRRCFRFSLHSRHIPSPHFHYAIIIARDNAFTLRLLDSFLIPRSCATP